ncbi:MAG TPA: PIN domain-containing protein, partial [Candidatus Thermoplasmatota archaeon]|nr:PIN domain-containing protein [Candidatus Thermoplasmatota archaeon]
MKRVAARRVFLDTGVLLAAVLPRDPDHEAAVALLHRLADGAWASAHTSDYVVAEALNFVWMKVKRRDTAEALLAVVFGTEEVPPALDPPVRIHG